MQTTPAVILVWMLCTLCSSNLLAADKWIENGDFEEGGRHWRGKGKDVTLEDGNRVWQIDADEEKLRVYQDFRHTDAPRVTIRCRARALEGYKGGGIRLSVGNVEVQTGSYLQYTLQPFGTWVDCSITVPFNPASERREVRITTQPGEGKIQIDDVVMGTPEQLNEKNPAQAMIAEDDSDLESNRLLTLKRQYENALTEATAPVLDRYRRQMETIINDLTRQGSLDQALVVKQHLKESAAKGLAPSPAVPDSPKLTILNEQKNEAVKRAIEPIQATYVAQLESSLEFATAGSRLEEAVAIRKELKLATSTKAPQAPPAPKVFDKEFLIGTIWEVSQGDDRYQWRFQDGRVQRWNPDSDGDYQPGGFLEWEWVDVSKREIRIHWNSGPETVAIKDDLTEIPSSKGVLKLVE